MKPSKSVEARIKKPSKSVEARIKLLAGIVQTAASRTIDAHERYEEAAAALRLAYRVQASRRVEDKEPCLKEEVESIRARARLMAFEAEEQSARAEYYAALVGVP